MIQRKTSTINVVEAAYQRVKNIFNNGLKVYLSTSGGKDSICLMQIVYDLIQQGEINPEQLTVVFVDEEAMYDCVIDIVKKWRQKFLLAGARFDWYCLEVIHFNCLNTLEEDETFICWDRYKKDVWVRQPPPFAIMSHPLLRPRQETYQSFLRKALQDGITMVGSKVAESLQRLIAISSIKSSSGFNGKKQFYPIYDWEDNDVWLFIKERNLEIPEVYMYLWQVGTPKKQLRISQFFSIDTVRALLKLNEFYPDLMERVQRREPNAYLVALYWDSEMFRRSSKTRRELEIVEKPKDYKAECIKMLCDIPKYFPKPSQQKVAMSYKRLVLRAGNLMTQKHYKQMYEALVSGDPKMRTLRALYQKAFGDYTKELIADYGLIKK